MKRYLAFKGDDYYPSGGFEDFFGEYDNLEDAVSELEDSQKNTNRGPKPWYFEWAHIYDTELGEIIWDSYYKFEVNK